MADTRWGRRMFAAVRHLADRLRPPATGSDADLLARFAAGDEVAFAGLIGRHGPMVFGVCRRLTRSHHDAEDAFQAAFLVLAARPGAVRPPERLGAWLHGVAVNTSLKTLRRPVGPAVPDTPAPDVRHSRAYEFDDFAALHEEVARLPNRYRLPVVLCHLEGHSRRDAATALGWPEGTVSGRLARGLKLLGDRLRRRGVGLPVAALPALVPAELLAATDRSAILVAAGLAPLPTRLLPLTRGVFPVLPLRTAAVLLLSLGVGGVGLLARLAADPPAPTPATVPKPGPRWVEVAKLTRPEPITRLAFGAAGVAFGEADGHLLFWKSDLPDAAAEVLKGGPGKGHTKSVERLTFTRDGRWLCVITDGGRGLWRFRAVDMEGGHGVSGEEATYHDIAPDGQSFVELFSWSTKTVWLSPNLWKGEPAAEARDVKTREVEFDTEARRATLSADNAHLAVGLANGTVQMVSRVEMRKGSILPVAGRPPVELAFSPDSNRLAVVEPGGAVTLFAHGTGVKLATLPGPATALAWHPEGNVLATAGADKMIRLWDAATGKPGQILAGHTDAVTAVAFSPDGKRLASGSADKTARVWEFRR